LHQRLQGIVQPSSTTAPKASATTHKPSTSYRPENVSRLSLHLLVQRRKPPMALFTSPPGTARFVAQIRCDDCQAGAPKFEHASATAPLRVGSMTYAVASGPTKVCNQAGSPPTRQPVSSGTTHSDSPTDWRMSW
jgi:hypothetical protein